jgi:hypothetical protein
MKGDKLTSLNDMLTFSWNLDCITVMPSLFGGNCAWVPSTRAHTTLLDRTLLFILGIVPWESPEDRLGIACHFGEGWFGDAHDA